MHLCIKFEVSLTNSSAVININISENTNMAKKLKKKLGS